MSKCFAFARYGASVFHSVQIIEEGLVALGEFLGVKDPKSGWTAVAGELEKVALRTKYLDLNALQQKHFHFIEQMQGTVSGLKNAWRNKISHSSGRLILLTSDFSDEVAEEILLASRAFMRRLAEEMP
jgi:hypothetical protein